MLQEPELENPINPDALDMLQNSPKLYNQLTRDAVLASHRYERGLPLFDEYFESDETLDSSSVMYHEDASELARKEKIPSISLSFDDYYENWKNTSTSMEALDPNTGPIKARKLLKFKTLNTKVTNLQVQDILYT